jgi:hypothetical protein
VARYFGATSYSLVISLRCNVYTSITQRQCQSPYQRRLVIGTPRRHIYTTDRPRLSEASLTPKAFGGSAAEIENAERWLRYLNQYVQFGNLRDDEALTLFKLLLTDQAKDWLYALPDDQADSFHRLQEAFMSPYTPNPLQRYQKASHMWFRMQQENETVDSYFTAITSGTNQIKLRDEQQLCYCLIRGFKASFAPARPTEHSQ